MFGTCAELKDLAFLTNNPYKASSKSNMHGDKVVEMIASAGQEEDDRRSKPLGLEKR